jgi:DNA-binding transcriptional regulator YdaS (Cro superfamily)
MNTLQTWLESKRGRQVGLAKHLGLATTYVWRIGRGLKPVPMQHAAEIEQFTEGEVTRKDMFPNDWQRIWPEMADVSTPTTSPPADTPTNA